jgi:hypothetical protein
MNTSEQVTLDPNVTLSKPVVESQIALLNTSLNTSGS